MSNILIEHPHYWRIRRINQSISLFFLLFYCIDIIFSHYTFQKGMWDLGAFNQALWKYAHVQLARFLSYGKIRFWSLF